MEKSTTIIEMSKRGKNMTVTYIPFALIAAIMERDVSKEPVVLMVPRVRRFLEHLFTHILLASMGALSHIVYASKEEKVNSERKIQSVQTMEMRC